MKNRLKFCGGALCWSLGLFALGGCLLPEAQPDATRYFVLSARVVKPDDASVVPAKRVRLGLRRVEVPEFLRGRALLVRMAESEVRLNEDARWAEPLEAGVARVLREGLEARAQVASVVPVSAGSDLPRDYDVVVRVLRCEGVRDPGVARFVAAVEIYSAGEPAVRVAREAFTSEVPGWDGADYRDLAHKLSTAVNQLAEQTAGLLAGVKS